MYDNGLTGPVPAALARPTRLEELLFANNDLEGPVPPELGGIASLRLLDLSNNSAMSGTLPDNLTALRRLEVFLAGGTGLCAPGDAAFLDWLRSVSKRRVSPCDRSEGSTAYLTQTVQSRAFPVPLVADEAALLRVFVTAPNAADVGIPPVRATFYTEGTQTLVVDIPGQSSTIPAMVDEGSLSKSANAQIPGRILQPGLEMVIEIDPDGTLDPGLGVAERIPTTGRTALDVRKMPVLDLRMIPFLWSAAPDSSILDITGNLTADGELLSAVRILLPVEDINLEIHDPVLTSSNVTHDLYAETAAIRAMEGGTGHYLGLMAGPTTGPSGLAHNPGRVSFAVPFPLVIAHELGHNMSLAHAPCGGADGPDPAFPESDGAIGAWGYDFRDGGSLVPPRYRDVMGYCGPAWIGDYHFTSAFEFRYSDEGGADAPAAGPSESLLVWGGRDAGGNPFLEPVFVVDAPPALPPSGGSYQVTGATGGGEELFAVRFDMAEVADGDGSSVFAFVLPVRPEWSESLASITLSGPDGSFTLDRETDRPAAVLRDPLTGQVRGILRKPAPEFLAQPEIALSAERGLEVLISRGIPDAAAWRR